jgi:hypothetical protein
MTRAFLSLLALVLLTGLAQAGPLIWAGYFVGENHPSRSQAPPVLAQRLQQVFGFPFYRFVKGVNIDLRAPHDHWVMARPDFFVRIQAQPHAPGDPDDLAYEIYKDGFIIARGHYVIDPATPLFINGPSFHRGLLIFVIEAR